jgi:tetratricopeptide (TPR) repeat protein
MEEAKRHYAVGVSLLEKGEYNGAISEFIAAVAANAEFARPYLMIGRIKEIQGDTAAAESAYRTCMRLNPDMTEARYRLAKLLTAKGEISEPIQHLREAVTLNPTDWKIRTELDRLLIRDRRYDEALSNLREVTMMKPNMSEAHGLTGIIYYHEGRLAEAQNEFETAVRYMPEDLRDLSLFYFFLALVREEMGNRNAAVRDLKSALYYDPSNSMARAEMHLLNGRILASQGRIVEAKNEFRAAIEHHPSYSGIRGAGRDLEALPEPKTREGQRADSNIFDQ